MIAIINNQNNERRKAVQDIWRGRVERIFAHEWQGLADDQH